MYAVFFGASLLDLVQHIGFDIKLVTTRDGWNRPAKVVSRVAYLLCRTLSPTVLLLVLRRRSRLPADRFDADEEPA